MLTGHLPCAARVGSLHVVMIDTGGVGAETYCLFLDVIRQSRNPIDFRGFAASDNPDMVLLDRLGVEFLGDPRNLVNRIPSAYGWSYSLGIGNPKHRRQMDEILSHQGLKPLTVIHPKPKLDLVWISVMGLLFVRIRS